MTSEADVRRICEMLSGANQALLRAGLMLPQEVGDLRAETARVGGSIGRIQRVFMRYLEATPVVRDDGNEELLPWSEAVELVYGSETRNAPLAQAIADGSVDPEAEWWSEDQVLI